MRIAVFASGAGTNFQAMVDDARLKKHIKLLVCDHPLAGVLKRAKQAGVPYFSFKPKDYPNKEHFEQEILQLLQKMKIDFIVLAGYMRLIGPVLLKAFDRRMINLHPSLLPNFPGKDAIGQALLARSDETGVTVHFVDQGMDTGEIIAQERVCIAKDDTKATLTAKIHQVEHHFYKEVIKRYFLEKEDDL
ncbi:phosphoribosylglycinamide formyltransferase [Listeria sp. PSOL-1]|uniref:phosphoribosylglycinamide formyltransferase n=1 Tax=Listeria sp. PSOL-1 TaxID=1844999 RepID=UPI0013D4BE36|nr:phosphoribosylglycinamide formyltransferase [Listeria sp. PSOL-1]